jgi:hypothetical protein
MGTERATVTGRVVDVNGASVAGAAVVVRLTGEHATSDASGAFSLDVPADTTLTIATSATGMAPTLLAQFLVSPGGSTSVQIPLLTADHLKNLIAMGSNMMMGGAIAVSLRSVSGATPSATGATIELTPSNLGTVLYAPTSAGFADPDPKMTAFMPGTDPAAWALGVQPHVSIMKLTLHGATQVQAPIQLDDVEWPGTFTVDAGALTLVTLFTP